MGLLDTITSVLGGKEGLQEQALKGMLENVLGKGNAEVGNLLKNVDLSKAGELIEFFKKNGLPDTKEEIQELISKFSAPQKPATKK